MKRGNDGWLNITFEIGGKRQIKNITNGIEEVWHMSLHTHPKIYQPCMHDCQRV